MEIGSKPFIVAELSANHRGRLDTALMMIETAALVGCNAVKLQTYELDDLPNPDPANIVTPREWYPWLFNKARECHIHLFSSVFSVNAVEFLAAFNCPAYKIASPESTRLSRKAYREIYDAIRKFDKPIWASSGREDWEDVADLKPNVMLYCKSGYPATIDDSDIEFFVKTRGFRCQGFSDHTTDLCSPLAFMAAGARIIEKHFKLTDECVDAAFSFNPLQMRQLCDIARFYK